jgi:hypothetical protein
MGVEAEAPMSTLRDLATSAPASRDRFVDLVRAASVVIVVLGHWTLAAVTWDHGSLDARNLLEVQPGLRLATWAFQVMPLFFLVGGAVDLRALRSNRRRGRGWPAFVADRELRLLWPVVVLTVSWMLVGRLMLDAGLPRADVAEAVHLAAQPLWFLAVYLGLVAAAPLMLRLHERWRWWVPAALATGATAVDLAAGAVPAVGWANYALVFLFAHQLGFAYGDGSAARWPRRRVAAAALGALATLALLTAGPYPLSMVGVGGDTRSNMSPPSVCIVALTLWLGALALLAEPALTRVLRRPRLWTVVVALNASIMTVFLWHLSALVVVVAAAQRLGFPAAEPATAGWWLVRPLWIASLTTVLALLVVVFGPVEHRRHRAAQAPAPAVGATTVVSVASLAVLALEGFGNPVAVPAAAALLGVVLVLGRGGPSGDLLAVESGTAAFR